MKTARTVNDDFLIPGEPTDMDCAIGQLRCAMMARPPHSMNMLQGGFVALFDIDGELLGTVSLEILLAVGAKA